MIGLDVRSKIGLHGSSGAGAILVILFAIVVFANLVALIGYPMLIVTAVIAAFGAVAFIVVLSADDMIDRPARPAAARAPRRRRGRLKVPQKANTPGAALRRAFVRS
jgi:hypothetical protein